MNRSMEYNILELGRIYIVRSHFGSWEVWVNVDGQQFNHPLKCFKLVKNMPRNYIGV